MKRRTDRRSSGFGLLDLLVVVVLIPLIAVILIGCQRRHGHSSGRMQCAMNLRQIGQALLLYANENRGAFPRTVYVPAEQVVPVWGTGASAGNPFGPDGPAPNDVTAAIFLLLRTQDITPEVFTCPSSLDERDRRASHTEALQRSNFSDIAKNLSYSMQNPYPNAGIDMGETWWTNTMSAEYAIAGDMNPGVTEDRVNVATVTTVSSSADMRRANSPNHDGDGQNVLYGDGHVEFQQNPFVGVKRDNIYTSQFGGVVASSANGDDSVLLPPRQ
jgi:prepilin-type processing-associated H-X9-DG protein